MTFKPPYWYHDNIKFSDNDIEELKNYLIHDEYKNQNKETLKHLHAKYKLSFP